MDSSIKTPLVLAGLFVLIVIVIAVLFLTAGDEAETGPVDPIVSQATSTGDGGSQLITDGDDYMDMMTKTGTKTRVRNFLADEDIVVYETDRVYLIDQEVGPEAPIFQTFYYAGGGINIVLLDENLAFARSRAESALQIRVGIPNAQLCSLEINVGTPQFISSELSGRNLGLSFCLYSTQL